MAHDNRAQIELLIEALDGQSLSRICDALEREYDRLALNNIAPTDSDRLLVNKLLDTFEQARKEWEPPVTFTIDHELLGTECKTGVSRDDLWWKVSDLIDYYPGWNLTIRPIYEDDKVRDQEREQGRERHEEQQNPQIPF